MLKATLIALMTRMQRHAFLSGVIAARNTPAHHSIDGPALWMDYSPHVKDAALWTEVCDSLTDSEADLDAHIREVAATDAAVARIAEQKRLDDGIAPAEVEGIARFERAGT